MLRGKQPGASQKSESLAATSNLLANPTGKERYLTVSSSHFVSFCRCLLFATKTEHADLAKLCNGHLSLEALLASSGTPCGNPLETMVRKGWSWEIIKADVEKSFPELPHLLAQGLNTDAAVQQGCGEMKKQGKGIEQVESDSLREIGEAFAKDLDALPETLGLGSSTDSLPAEDSQGPVSLKQSSDPKHIALDHTS